MAHLDAIRRVLDNTPGLALAVLFGSAARAAARRLSDLDVGVLFDEGTAVPRHLAVDLERASSRSVDLIQLQEAPPLLRFEIARDGQVLIERRPHAWSDFRARAMVDWWDWAATARLFGAVAAARARQYVGHEGHGQT